MKIFSVVAVALLSALPAQAYYGIHLESRPGLVYDSNPPLDQVLISFPLPPLLSLQSNPTFQKPAFKKETKKGPKGIFRGT